MHGFRLLHQPSASGYSGWACALSVVKRVSRARSERVNSFVEFINEHNSGRDRFISPDKLMDIVTFEQQLQAGLLRPVICQYHIFSRDDFHLKLLTKFAIKMTIRADMNIENFPYKSVIFW